MVWNGVCGCDSSVHQVSLSLLFPNLPMDLKTGFGGGFVGQLLTYHLATHVCDDRVPGRFDVALALLDGLGFGV